MSRSLPVVLLGGAANAVSAARSAGRLGLPVTVLADAPGRPPAASSRWTTAWQAPAPGAEVQSSWSAMLEQHPPAVLVPCSDNGVELLARRRADLVALGHAPAEGDDRFLLAMLDKQQTYDLADAAGIARPATQVVTDLASAADVADDLGYPCGAKPRVAHAFARLGTGSKGQVLHDRRELAAYLGPLLDAGAQMLLTEVVAGPDDAYCSYYGYRDGEGRELLQYTKRKLRQYPVRFGTGTYHLSDDVPEAAELGRRFFALSGLRGIGNVEFKRDSRDGQLKLIECNARLTAATELVRRSGIDLLELVYSGATGKAATAPTARYGLHQWVPLNDLRAARAYRRTGELSWPSWLRSLAGRQSFPLFSCSDPGPFLTAGAATGRRALRRGVRRLVRA